MAPFRNPFNRRPAALSGLGPVSDENARPGSNGQVAKAEGDRPGYAGSRAPSAISITRSTKEPDEFKMSGRHPHCPARHQWPRHGDSVRRIRRKVC